MMFSIVHSAVHTGPTRRRGGWVLERIPDVAVMIIRHVENACLDSAQTKSDSNLRATDHEQPPLCSLNYRRINSSFSQLFIFQTTTEALIFPFKIKACTHRWSARPTAYLFLEKLGHFTTLIGRRATERVAED